MNPIPKYLCHKEVRALKIDDLEWVDEGALLHPHDSKYIAVFVDWEWIRKHEPGKQGYYVMYDDGYTSWSPTEVFESGYKRIEE